MRNIEAYSRVIRTVEGKAEAILAGKEPETYTEILLADQNKRVQKLSSEVSEFVREDCRPDFDRTRFIGEGADTIYSLQVMVAARGLSFFNVMTVMRTEREAGRPSEEQLTMLLGNKPFLLRSLGASATGLVVEECRPDFDALEFLTEAANTLCLTGLVLSARGMTVEPAVDELVRRNIEMNGL